MPFFYYLPRHGIHVAILPVPVHPNHNNNCGQCEVVYGSQWQQDCVWHLGAISGCYSQTWECFMLSSSVLGLGGGYRGCSWSPCECVTQHADTPVPVHLHNHGVLPPAGQAVYHVPVSAANTGHPPTVSTGRQVSLEYTNIVYLGSSSGKGSILTWCKNC